MTDPTNDGLDRRHPAWGAMSGDAYAAEQARLETLRAFSDDEWNAYLLAVWEGATDADAIASATGTTPTALDIGDRCVSCGLTTAPGSGRFVNRIPADSSWETDAGAYVQVDGWLCEECQSIECSRCGEGSASYEFIAFRPVCDACLEVEE